MSRISHFCGRIFKHKIFKRVYNGKKEHKNIIHSHLYGIETQLNEFHTILSQIFTTYNFIEHSFRNLPHFFQKESITTHYSSSNNETLLTGPKRKNLADFPGSPRFHTIDLEFLNQNTHHRLTKTELSKNKAIAFDRNSPLLVSTPMQRHLDLF